MKIMVNNLIDLTIIPPHLRSIDVAMVSGDQLNYGQAIGTNGQHIINNASQLIIAKVHNIIM